jgi:hypothetical protein
MPFNVDAFREAHRPWILTVGGRAFAARHVSAPQVQRYQDRIKEAGDDLARFESAVRWLLRRAFPWRPSYLLRGDPARIVLRLEPAARSAALADVYEALRGTATPPTQGEPSTSGTPSPTPTSTRE